ncbi:MAG: hypothetical protein ACPL7M_08210 [Bryobacteraceae bacterium]
MLFPGKSVTSEVRPAFRMAMPFTCLFFSKGQVAGRFMLMHGVDEFDTLLPGMPEKVEFNLLEAVLCDFFVKND